MSIVRRGWPVLVLGAALVGGLGLALAVDRSADSTPAIDEPVARVAVDRDALAELPADRRLVVRVADPLTPRMDGPVYELRRSGVRRAGRLACKRVALAPTGSGLCMALSGDGRHYEGVVFGRGFAPRLHFPVTGVPDRARVSPDGRFGAYTTFDRGSSEGYFASLNDFSTNTQIVDLRTGRSVLRPVSGLVVSRGGRHFAPRKAQYWGVTFAGGTRFYVTLAAAREHYLVAADIRTRRGRVIARHVECPAISPDRRRIAYKRRIGDSNRWRLYVLDLRSGRRTPLAERRSIDDQPEWVGNSEVVYSDDRAVFVVPANGSGRPRRIAGHASSPAYAGGSSGDH